MATLTLQTISRTGITPTVTAAGASGDKFTNDGKTFLRVVNANVSTARTVTVASQIGAGAVPQGTASANLSVSGPASGEKWIGPFETNAWNDSDGKVNVTYSSEADLTVAAYKL